MEKFYANKMGSTSVEFSMLVLPFFFTLFAILSVGYSALIQAELDRAAGLIASDISLHATNYTTSTGYLNQVGCSKFLGALLDCKKVELSAINISGDLRDYDEKVNDELLWSPGCGNDLVLIELIYPFSASFSPIAIADVVFRGGHKYYRSRSIIKREPILTGAGSC